MKTLKLVFSLLILSTFLVPQSRALEHIVRPYQGIRASGMGGVKITTGLYDENFFGNPARVTANPKKRFTIFDLFLETTPQTISSTTELTNGGSQLSSVSETAGDNLHARIQTAMPAYYYANPNGNISWALALITSSQIDLTLRRSYQLDPTSVVDIGPAFTIGRRFLDDRALSVGLTAHMMYRAATRRNFNLADFVKGGSFSLKSTGDDGAMLDFDVGAQHEFTHWTPADFQFSAGLAINNLLGGGFKNIPFHPLKVGRSPVSQPTSVGLGGSVTREQVFLFSDFVAALEFQDMGNNKHGSFFRTIHAGTEARWRKLKPRVGLYQGYLAAGLGIELRFFMVDVATYGEEMSLNTGGKEDRRVALKLAFKF